MRWKCLAPSCRKTFEGSDHRQEGRCPHCGSRQVIDVNVSPLTALPLPEIVPPRLAPAVLVERPDLPARERPFREEEAAELKYELAVRAGPYARCSYCTFFPDYRVDLTARPECPRCRRVGTLARWHRWAPAMIVLDERANDWARRVAEGLKLQWPANSNEGPKQ